jgi:pimeloyl-ACP methyl ester carboxylesterase
MKICFFHHEYLDELEFAEGEGFDGLCVNEHHNNADGLMPSPNLWGDADRANPVVYAEEWQRRIKDAVLRLLPGGHMALHEAPDAAAAAVTEFLGP